MELESETPVRDCENKKEGKDRGGFFVERIDKV